MAFPGIGDVQRRYGGKKKRRRAPTPAPPSSGPFSGDLTPPVEKMRGTQRRAKKRQRRAAAEVPETKYSLPSRPELAAPTPTQERALRGAKGKRRRIISEHIARDLRDRRERVSRERFGTDPFAPLSTSSDILGLGHRSATRTLTDRALRATRNTPGRPRLPHYLQLGTAVSLLESAESKQEQRKILTALERESDRFSARANRYAGKTISGARKIAAERAAEEKRSWLDDVVEHVGDAWEEGPGGEALAGAGWLLRGGQDKDTVRTIQTSGGFGTGDELLRKGWKGGLKGAGTALAAIPTAQDLIKSDNPDVAAALSLIDPTIILGGEGALAKAGVRARASMRELERLGAGGVVLKPQVMRLIKTAASTGDATRLAEVLARYEKATRNLATKGRTRGRELPKSGTQQLADLAADTRAQGIELRTKVGGTPERHALPGGRETELASEMLSLAPARRLRRPGARFGLKYPRFIFQGKTEGKLPGFRGLESLGISGQVPLPVPLKTPVPAYGAFGSRKERRAFAEDLARREVQLQYAPQLEELSARIAADPELGPQLTRELETLRRNVDDQAELAAGAAELPRRWEKIPDVLARRTVQQQLRAAALHERSIQRAVSGRTTRMYHAAIRPLGKSPDPDALLRVKNTLWAAEARAAAQVDMPPLKSEAEELVAKQLRDVHDELLRQGQSAGFLGATGREGYVARHWEQQVAEGMDAVLDGLIRGGKGDFTNQRQYSSVFERANRVRVAEELQRAWPELDTSAAVDLAENLWRTGAHREMGRLAARAAQRGRPWDIGTAPTPTLFRDAVRERDDIFQNLDASDQQALLRPDARERFLPDIEDDLARLESTLEDLTHADQQLGAVVRTEDQGLIDAWTTAVERLNDELMERRPPTAAMAPDDPGFGGVSALKDRDYEMLREILSTIHPALRDVRNGNTPLTWQFLSHDNSGFVAAYEEHPHRIVLNKGRLEEEFGKPLDQLTAGEGMVLRRTLLHELAHARTFNSGGVFSPAMHVAERGLERYTRLASRELSPEQRADTAAVYAHARELREEEILETGSMREIHRRSTEVRERLLQSFSPSGRHPDEIPWNDSARAVLNRLMYQEVSGGYMDQRRAQGAALFTTGEGTARYFELMVTDPENWVRAVGPELDDWLRNDVLKIQLGMEGVDLSPEALAYNDLIMGPDGVEWVAGKHPALAEQGAPKPVGDMADAVRSMATGGHLTPEKRAAVLKAREERKLEAERKPPTSAEMGEPPPGHPAWEGDAQHDLNHEVGQEALGIVTKDKQVITWPFGETPGSTFVASRHADLAERFDVEPVAAFTVDQVGRVDKVFHYRETGELGLVDAVPPGHWTENAVASVYKMPRRQIMADNPAPFEVKANDDVWDPHGYLDQRGKKRDAYPVIDPRSDAHWRAGAQARATAFNAHWRVLDLQYGRTSDHRSLRPQGEGQWVDTEGGVWIEPTILNNQPLAPYIGEARVWPARVVQQARIEALRLAPWEDIHKRGVGHLTERFLRQTRWSVTSPFPAYHIRNMMSDVLLSLQADTGVMFHPAAWAVSANAMGVTLKSPFSTRGLQRSFDIDVPNVGKMPWEDFLFMADALGIRSGENFADFSRILDKHPDLDVGFARSWAQKFQRGTLNFGTSREDIMRSATFLQAMRRNGGDAAEAAHTMIRHHFDYGDLSLMERQVMRNTFMFYTWYRKNIPLQLAELWRRPGFFTTLAHNYEQALEGEHPLQIDYSKALPFLPDLSGKPPTVAGLPEYLQERLGALPMSWNGDATFIGFGAPVADLAMFSESGARSWGSLLNPYLATAGSVGSGITTGGPGINLLTGKRLHAVEPSALAELLDAAGVSLPEDSEGRAVLPWWAERIVGGLLPAASRGLSPIRASDAPLFSLERLGGVAVGINKTSYDLKERKDTVGIAANDFKRTHLAKLDDIRNLSDPDRKRAAHKVWTEAFDQLDPKVQRAVVDQMNPDEPGGETRSYAKRKREVRLYTRQFTKGYQFRTEAEKRRKERAADPYVPGEGNPGLEDWDPSAPAGPITPKRNRALEGWTP